jgi:hypothetical protein
MSGERHILFKTLRLHYLAQYFSKRKAEGRRSSATAARKRGCSARLGCSPTARGGGETKYQLFSPSSDGQSAAKSFKASSRLDREPMGVESGVWMEELDVCHGSSTWLENSAPTVHLRKTKSSRKSRARTRFQRPTGTFSKIGSSRSQVLTLSGSY